MDNLDLRFNDLVSQIQSVKTSLEGLSRKVDSLDEKSKQSEKNRKQNIYDVILILIVLSLVVLFAIVFLMKYINILN